MTKVFVSVVMGVRNVDRFLGEAIESILNQRFEDFEFIIVDYGSTDRSKSIVLRYSAADRRIRFHEIPNCGLAEARNAGCGFARGKYLAVMDADDIAIRDRLTWQVEFMEKHPEVGVLGGAVELIDGKGAKLAIARNPVDDCMIQSALVRRCPLWHPTVLIRREAFVLVGGYRAAFTAGQDYDLWLRIAEHFKLANLEQVVLRYRIHPNQVSLRKRRQQTLCCLAALVSAQSRRSGDPDPLISVEDVTPEALARLGISEATQKARVAAEYLEWIRNMSLAREYSAVLNAANELLQSSDRKYAERWVIAEVQLVMAKVLWKQGRFVRSALTASHAVITRPVILGRPIKRLLLHPSPSVGESVEAD